MSVSHWDLIYSVSDCISIYDGAERFIDDFLAAPNAARTLYVANWCYYEVCNGGFKQFFGNSTGILAPEAVTAFSEIGMPCIANIVKQATLWFGEPYPRDRGIRLQQIEKYKIAHHELSYFMEAFDDEFYSLCNSENGGFEAAANAYAIKSNA